jgi:hypothetical protein
MLTPGESLYSSLADYNDDRAVADYLELYWDFYMTDLEKRCYHLGLRRFKAEQSENTAWRRSVFAEWDRITDAEQRAALADGFLAFRARVRSRILGEFQAGVWHVNRCPQCRRVVRTPTAHQCFWCGRDWHT